MLQALFASSCFLPEQFQAKIKIGKDGSYSLSYDGTLTHWLARGVAVEGQLSQKDEAEMKRLEADFKKNSSCKSVVYRTGGIGVWFSVAACASLSHLNVDHL